MKRFLCTTAAAVAFSTTALADDQLRTTVENDLQGMSIAVDTSLLSDEQINRIFLVTTSSDTHGEKANKIEAILQDNAFATMKMGDHTVYVPMNNLHAQVQSGLMDQGFEVDVSTLSDQKVAELYLALNSNEQAEVGEAIEAVLQ